MSPPRAVVPRSLASNWEWRRWGQSDPFWAVATERGRAKGEALPWTAEDFYATGESDWRDFSKHWHQFGLDTDTCLEIGCGAGRITHALSKTFDRVIAVDVSEAMLEQARQGVAGHNVHWKLSGLNLPVPDESVSAVFSTHVLQHLDNTETMLWYFYEAFRVLRPGGTLMIHVPVIQWPGTGRIAEILRLLFWPLRIVSNAMAWSKRRLGVRLMRMSAIPVPELFASVRAMGFEDIEIRFVAASRNQALHSFVMARKASAAS